MTQRADGNAEEMAGMSLIGCISLDRIAIEAKKKSTANDRIAVESVVTVNSAELTY